MDTTEITDILPRGLLEKWLNILPFPAFIFDEVGTLRFGNKPTKGFRRSLELSNPDLTFWKLVALGQTSLTLRDIKARLDGGDYLVQRIEFATINEIYLIRATRIPLDGTSFLCAILAPFNSIDNAEHADMLDTIGAMVFQLHRDASISYLNDSVYEDLGYNASEEQAVTHLKDFNTSYTEEVWGEAVRRMSQGQTIRHPAQFKCKDGSLLPVMVTVRKNRFSEYGTFTMTAQNVSELRDRERQLQQALNKVEQLSRQLQIENRALRAEIGSRDEPNIVSADPAYRAVLKKVAQAAPTNIPVLITGESGTGKELLAKRVHALSNRSDRPMIVVDCSALPATLIESELFGHKKGAFTGAHKDHPGKFAQADGGTIFLDEIGEMPIDLQTRLLRVLQDGSYIPLGGQTQVRADARVIAATNRDLRAEVDKGNFRLDLYYRLNVFPIHNPPLRDRRRDVEPLLWHFVQKHGARIGRHIESIDPNFVRGLLGYNFPGNIRELENIVQRALIYADGPRLERRHLLLPIGENGSTTPTESGSESTAMATDWQTLEDHQRAYIRRVLDHTNNKVSGPGGAAELLGMKAQTLHSRLRKLGLR